LYEGANREPLLQKQFRGDAAGGDAAGGTGRAGDEDRRNHVENASSA